MIAGAGAAGAVAAQTLREAGFGGRIVMLDRENRVPYDRTVLSKYALSGEPGAEKTPLQVQSFYKSHKIERRTAEIVRLDAASRRIECADGIVLHYDTALLATGCTPRRPDIPGMHLNNVFALRCRADADAILAQAERIERAVILGASFIGMEVAASLRERGLEVTVVGKEKTPFKKLLGSDVGSAFASLHAQRGVEFRFGRSVHAIEGKCAVEAVRLNDGETIPAELIVIGLGVQPATGYLQGVALNGDGGIPVDAHLRASDGLFAAGDIRAFRFAGRAPRSVWNIGG